MKNLVAFLCLLLFFSNCQQSQTASNSNNQNQQNTAQPTEQLDTNNPANAAQNAEIHIGVTQSQPASTTNQNPNSAAQNSKTATQNAESTPSVSEANSDTEIADLPTDAALLYKGLLPRSQAFDINGSEIDVKRMDCRGGTVIMVNPKAFEFEDGTPATGDIVLKVTEYLTKEQMILSPLTTMTRDNRTLESAGMIHAYAFAKGKLLRLKKGEEIHVGFRVSDDERFELFDGSVQAGTNLIDWTIAPKPRPNNQIVHTKVDKQAKFGYGSLQEYWIRHFIRPRALQKYKGECFSIAAFATIDKVGKLDKVRLVENKELFLDLSADTAFLGAVKRMPNWVPAFKNGKPVASRTLITINYCGANEDNDQIQIVKPEAYAASMRLLLDKMLATSEDNVLFFSSKSLGWINCDRFYSDPRPKTHLLVDAGGQAADVKLVFKKMNGIMPLGRTKDKQFKSPDVPIGEPVSVVGFRKEGNQMYFGIRETTVDNKVVSLNFEPVTDAELKQKIKTLNGID